MSIFDAGETRLLSRIFPDMANSVESLEQLRASVDDEEEAVEAIRALETSGIEDAAYHVALARWAEYLAEPEIALREWNLALRDSPDDMEVLRHLVDGYLDAGNLEKAVRVLRRLLKVKPDDVAGWETLVEALRQMGELEQAQDARKRAALLTGDSKFQGRLEAADRLLGVESSEHEPDEAFLALFQERFQGREGVYARQWVNPNGSTGYTPVREPLSLKAVKMHFHGSHTLGIYPLRMDNTVHFAAFDLDLSPTVLKNAAPGTAGWNEALEDMAGYANLLEGRAEQMGIALHRVDSGYKGLHLWALFGEPIPAKQARQMCKVIAHGIAVPPNVRCELFPKQNSLPPDGLGNLIKVPLGVHRKTGRRAWFTRAEQTWAAQRAYLQQARLVSRDQLSQCHEVYAEEELALLSAPTPEEEEGGKLSVSLLEPPLYDPAIDNELQLVLSRCVTLRALMTKVDHTGQLEHDEVRVLTHTIGHLATGPSAVNWVLARCLQTDPALFMKRPLRGNPMSCARIRSKIPEVTSGLACDCQFSRRGGLYPTPSLHLSQTSVGLPVEQLQFQALLSDFLRAKKEANRWAQLLEDYSFKVGLWFEEAGVDEMRTPFGLLRRVVDKDTGDAIFELTV